MSFDNLSDFLAMGGHGPYVWSAYGIALIVILFNIIRPQMLNRQILIDRTRLLRREIESGESRQGEIDN